MNVGLPGQGLLQGYKTGAEGSPEVAAAPWAALGEVGREVSQLGERAMDTLVRLQREDNRRLASEAMLRAEELSSGFELRMRENDDPALWQEQWPKERDAFLKSELEGRKLAPEQRALISEGLTAWSSRSTLRVREIGTISGIQRGRVATERLLAKAAETGNVDLGLATIRDSGLPKDQAEKLAGTFLMEEERERLMERADHEPDVVMAELEARDAKGMPVAHLRTGAEARRQIAGYAKEKQEELRAGSMDSLLSVYRSGTLREEDIAAARFLTDADRAVWQAVVDGRKPRAADTHAEAWQVADRLRRARYDPRVTAREYRELYNDARAGVLEWIPDALEGGMEENLAELSPEKRDLRKLWPPGFPTRMDLGAAAREVIGREVRRGWLGQAEAEILRVEAEARIAGGKDLTAEQVKAEVHAEMAPFLSVRRVGEHDKLLPGTGRSLRTEPPSAPGSHGDGVRISPSGRRAGSAPEGGWGALLDSKGSPQGEVMAAGRGEAIPWSRVPRDLGPFGTPEPRSREEAELYEILGDDG